MDFYHNFLTVINVSIPERMFISREKKLHRKTVSDRDSGMAQS